MKKTSLIIKAQRARRAWKKIKEQEQLRNSSPSAEQSTDSVSTYRTLTEVV